MSESGSRLWPWVLAAWVVAAALRYPIADIPLERDEGEYGYIAQRWMLGEVPYRDSFDQKPPGSFAAYAVIIKLFGETPAAIHWGTLIYSLGTLTCIAIAGQQIGGHITGGVAAVLAAFMTSDRLVLGNAANAETFMILPLTAALTATLAAADRGSARWAFAAGVFGALACLCKQIAAPNVLLHAFVLVVYGRLRLKLLAANVAGGVVAVAPVVAYFAWAGALGEFYDCVLGHNFRYASRVPLHEYHLYFWETFEPMLYQWAPIFALALVGLILTYRKPWRFLTLLWLLAALAGISAGGYFRSHYYFQMIPPLAVLAGRGVAGATWWLPGDIRAVVAAVACVVALVTGVAMSWEHYFDYDEHPYRKVRDIYGLNPFPETQAAADWLASRTAADEPVYVHGSEPQILFHARRPSASRYIFAYPLMTPFADTLVRQEEVIGELERRRPRYVVVATTDMSFIREYDKGTPRRLDDWLNDRLARDYRVAATIEPYSLALDETPNPSPERLKQSSLIFYERPAGR